jgi:UDP-N-acetylglucosamine--N-acetylmuramyl-(pentapeptide) pyrophosphoryl-undecaprenol N-acetylglucosamine transferase
VLRENVRGLHIIHQTGEKDFKDAQAAYQSAGFAAEVSPFITDMPGVFARADLLICRSGASTVGEVTAAGKPAIFVPFPRAADDHQKVNAKALVDAGAAAMLEESSLSGATLADMVATLVADPARLQQMGKAAKALSHPNAAQDVARMAATLAGMK